MNDTKIDDGGPAFPCDVQVEDNSGSHYEEHYGLTIRDYAIIHFMAALMQREEFSIELGRLKIKDCYATPSFIAAEHADAMLAARNKKE